MSPAAFIYSELCTFLFFIFFWEESDSSLYTYYDLYTSNFKLYINVNAASGAW